MNPSLHRRSPKHAQSVGLMLLSAACFVVNVLLIRALADVQSVSVWLISSVRFAVGLALIVAIYGREFQPSRLFRSRKLAERDVLGGIGVYAFYVTVIELGPGRATFINNTYVIWGALMAVWLLKERFQAILGVGAVAALGGLALLTNPFAAGAHAGIYDLLAVFVALASAYIVITIRQLHATESTATIFSAQCVYGLLICGVPALIGWPALSSGGWALLLAAGLAAGIGQILMTRAFRELSVAEGSLLQMLLPLGIAAGGMIFFDERFTPREFVGAGLILAGSVVPAWRGRKPTPPPTD